MDQKYELAVVALARAYAELNAIRARDGAPPGVDPDYFSSIVELVNDATIELTGRDAHCHPALYNSGEIK